MGKHYLVLGAGMQGTAAAYDLVRFGDADRVTLADCEYDVAKAAAIRVNGLCGNYKVVPDEIDAMDTRELAELMGRPLMGVDACLSAVPYKFSPTIAEVCVATHTHFNDLGGNTEVVEQVLAMHSAAKAADVSLVPDCGVAPGIINILARQEIDKYENDVQVDLYCGGLPQNHGLPYGYRILFSPNGLTNEYSGEARVIQNGVYGHVETLANIKPITLKLDPYVIDFECAPTSGGTSNCPQLLQGRVDRYEYRTLRYPGHFAAMKAFKDFGFFEEQQKEEYGWNSLRDIFHAQAEKVWSFPKERDVLYLAVFAQGTKIGEKFRSGKSSVTLVDSFDPETGFSAMERTTAFGASIVTIMQAQGEIWPGAATPGFAVVPARYSAELVSRGFNLRREW